MQNTEHIKFYCIYINDGPLQVNTNLVPENVRELIWAMFVSKRINN